MSVIVTETKWTKSVEFIIKIFSYWTCHLWNLRYNENFKPIELDLLKSLSQDVCVYIYI